MATEKETEVITHEMVFDALRALGALKAYASIGIHHGLGDADSLYRANMISKPIDRLITALAKDDEEDVIDLTVPVSAESKSSS